MRLLIPLLVSLTLSGCTAMSQPGATRPALACPDIYNGCFSD